jgi:DNA mismatch endonuclease, patch repair protein
MADIVDSAMRSRMMAGIRSRNTRPEIALRSSLHKRGLRFRLHVSNLPGKPDLVLPRFSAAIFVHGCFWHRHANCRYTSVPSTRTEFWQVKFADNVKRDLKNRTLLLEMGWRVALVWECSLRSEIDPVSDAVYHWLKDDNDAFLEI